MINVKSISLTSIIVNNEICSTIIDLRSPYTLNVRNLTNQKWQLRLFMSIVRTVKESLWTQRTIPDMIISLNHVDCETKYDYMSSYGYNTRGQFDLSYFVWAWKWEKRKTRNLLVAKWSISTRFYFHSSHLINMTLCW